jgi:predicted ATPase
LHRRIGEVLRDQFTVAAAAEPELLAHHFSRAGVPEAAVEWWGKAGQQSLERSALMEATEQLTRALDLITKLPATAALRREEIKLQAALLTPLLNIKGYAAPETKAAVQRARLLIEQAETLGEPPEDQLLLFSVLYVFWTTNYVAFNCDVCLELAAHFLKLAEQQETSAPVMVGHRLVAMSLLYAGHIAQGREHCDQAITLYDTTEHRALATRFGADSRVSALAVRALAMWVLGYPDMACSDAIHAVSDARQIGQAASLMYALVITSLPLILSGSCATAAPNLDEALVLADATSSLNWRAFGMCDQGCLLALAGKTADAVPTIIAGVAAWRSVGATLNVPLYLAYLAKAHAELDQMDDASRCIGEAMTTIHATGERWCEAEVHRTAGEIALLSSELDAAKAEGYFQRALAVARQQQAKSWELRASMSLARLWRDQGKPQRARELLAPVYGWFTEGFDTRDLKEAKTLLEQLAI